MQRRRLINWATVMLAAVLAALMPLPATSVAWADPVSGVIYQLGNTPCLKGRGNCAIYPKAAQLPSGRQLVSFELATVAPSGGAAGETVPVYKSDDGGASWQLLSQVKPPSQLSSDPAVAKYTSNWGSPGYLVLPQAVGKFAAGTVLLSTVVTGEDQYYKEQKAANPNWVPTNDGDRQDMALALFSSTDQGATWAFQNIITTGGWQGGSAGASGTNVANANTYRAIDPVWEPFLMVYNNQLVTYYSDENDYIGYNTTTGAPTIDPANATAPDAQTQILAHRTWDGNSAAWSSPVVDEPGLNVDRGNGKTEIGGGRPGMTTIAPTKDGQYIMTYEYFGGGSIARYKISSNPLAFFKVPGNAIANLPVAAGSQPLNNSGSPVITTTPDGRITYDANNSGDVWVNYSGLSNGAWTDLTTPVGAGYSRTMLNLKGTDRLMLFQGVWGGPDAGSTIRYGEVSLTPPPPAKTIRNANTALCLDDYQLNTQPGASVVQWSCNGQNNQLWSVRTSPTGGGASILVNGNSGLCLDDYNQNTAPGSTVVQWTCNGQTNQAWTMQAGANGTSTIKNVYNGLCLENYTANAQAGAPVRQNTCNGSTDQLWTIA